MVAIFYAADWQLGAVEAISLSILVGTSVDYCVHLVEGYILAGSAMPPNLHSAMVGYSFKLLRCFDMLHVDHISLHIHMLKW